MVTAMFQVGILQDKSKIPESDVCFPFSGTIDRTKQSLSQKIWRFPHRDEQELLMISLPSR